MYQCNICNNKYISQQSLNAHKRKHTSYTQDIIKCCSILSKKEIVVNNLQSHNDAYIKNSKICPICGTSFIENQKIFCSASCSAKNRNTGRLQSKECKTKISEKLRKNYPFTRVFFNICQRTGIKFYTAKRPKKYHPSIFKNKTDYTRLCQFSHNVYQFPLYYDLDLLKLYGWYSTPGSRKGIRNLNGISRDHLYSITDGWKNNIDPSMISHPANCKLVHHRDNQTKNTKSIITFNELVEMIDEFKLWHERKESNPSAST